MSIPIHDVQFWVATAIAAGALWFVLKNLLPPGWLPFSKPKARQTKTSITVKGKPVDRD